MEVMEYDIQAEDGEIGHVDNFILNDNMLKIEYVVVKICNLFKKEKKVLLPVNLITKVNHPRSGIHVELTEYQLANSPKYNTSAPIHQDLKNQIQQYYKNEKNYVE
jgi:hypothetical protein